MTDDLQRRLVAEAIGTGFLVMFGAGSVVAALTLARNLDYVALGMIALAFAFALALAIYAFATTSGAHVNPAVTVALAFTGRFPQGEVIPYVVAQTVGAVIGALAIVVVFGGEAADAAAVGTTQLAEDVSYIEGLVAEALATFLLMTTIMAVAVDRRAAPGFAGLAIGLALGVSILFIGVLTGGSLNPARTFGPLFIDTIWGGETNWGELPLYIVGPVVGAVAAAVAYDYVARPREAERGLGEPPQGTAGDIAGRRRAAGEGAPTAVAPTSRQGTGGDVPGRRR